MEADGRKQDMRFKVIESGIRIAFYSLMQTTPYDKITVTDLCNEAKISRKTFYAHYSNMDALLQAMSEQLLNAFNLRGMKSVFRYEGKTYKELVKGVRRFCIDGFKNVRRNSDRFHIMMHNSSSAVFRNMMTDMLREYMSEIISE